MHPSAVVLESRLESFACFGDEINLVYRTIDRRLLGDTASHRCFLAVERNTEQSPIGTSVMSLLVNIQGIVFTLGLRGGLVVHLNAVDVHGKIFGEHVRRLVVGHYNERMHVYSLRSFDRKHGIYPLVRFNFVGRQHPKLLGIL